MVTPRSGGPAFYVECYVHSKWWFLEQFLSELLENFGADLALEREYNVAWKGLRRRAERTAFLHGFAGPVADDATIARARRQARDRWPVELHAGRDAERVRRLLIEGDDLGRYVQQPNRHGYPWNSLPYTSRRS